MVNAQSEANDKPIRSTLWYLVSGILTIHKQQTSLTQKMQSYTTQSSPSLHPPPSTHRLNTSSFIIHISRFPSSQPRSHTWPNSTFLCAALKPNPKGFGSKKVKKPSKDDEFEEEIEDDYDRQDSVIPEIVTNRMINRIGLSVGIPLFIGLLFFPFFYYLKVVLKIDIPTIIPAIVSFVFFGTALAGVSYGIVSTSWDPLREGSFLGWNEAQRNWPVFWGSIWNGGNNSKSKKLK